MFMRLRLLVIALFGVFLAGPLQAQNLTVGWSAVSVNAPFWVMQDAGFLEKEGLDARLIYIPSSSTIAQAQISGTWMSPPPTVRSSSMRISRAAIW